MTVLKPEYLESVPDAMVELYSDVEISILKSFAQRISAMDFFILAAQWQMVKLQEMGFAQPEIIAALADIAGKTETEITQTLQKAGTKALKADDAIYVKAGLKPAPLAASDTLQKVLDAGHKKTLGTFRNLSGTIANTATKQFEDALDRVWLQVSTGAFAPDEAITMAIKDLSKQGVNAISYKSKRTGNIRTDPIEVAVRRATMTSVNQTCGQLQEARADELGSDLVEVTAHAGARPEHAEWQGKIYSRSGKHPRYPPLKKSTGYGDPDGLKGVNCKHDFFPFIEGISEKTYTKKELNKMDAPKYTYNGKDLTEYEAVSRQREIERNIRRWKREEAAMKAAGKDTSEAASKTSDWRKIQSDYLKQTGLKRQYAREQIGE